MLKRFRQELIFIPAMLILIELLRQVIYHFYPDTAMFDRGSELETYFTRVWQITWITCGTWVLLRVSFPAVHKSLRDFYSGFENLPESDKRSIALKFFFCFFFGLIFLMSGRASNETSLRLKLVDTLNSQLHVREATGNNDGIEVEKYLSFVGQKQGASWCAAFVSYNLHAVGISTPPNPQTAWSPSFAYNYVIWSTKLEKEHKSKEPQPGDCFTIYSSELRRVGHVGFIVGEQSNYFITIEGNTGLNGSREGSGVHKYKREKGKVFTVTDYITPYLTANEKANIHFYNNNYTKLLRAQTHRKFGKVKRENGNSFCKNRHLNSTRYGVSIQSGQFTDQVNCSSGQNRSYQYAGGCNRILQIEAVCENSQREIRSKGFVQRTGRKSEMARAANYRAFCNCTRCTTRKESYRNYRSTIYSQMG